LTRGGKAPVASENCDIVERKDKGGVSGGFCRHDLWDESDDTESVARVDEAKGPEGKQHLYSRSHVRVDVVDATTLKHGFKIDT